MKANALNLIYGLSLLLSGCMVGPDYHPPETTMPSKFIEANESLERDSSDSSLCEWWKLQFNDPFLDALISQAVRANFDFRIALEKILQARAQYRIERSHLWPEIDFNACAVRSRSITLATWSRSARIVGRGDRPCSRSSGQILA